MISISRQQSDIIEYMGSTVKHSVYICIFVSFILGISLRLMPIKQGRFVSEMLIIDFGSIQPSSGRADGFYHVPEQPNYFP